MVKLICKKELCTGCSACYSACPTDSIVMRQDEEGFYRPIIDESTCVQCEKCIKACPINNIMIDDGTIPRTFAARINDNKLLSHSSSGGVFTALAKTILDEGGIIFGAAFDDNFNVEHRACRNIDGLDELRKSKYVQSYSGKIYQEVKELLNDGSKVLFCGSPCQVGGIKSYLGKDYSNFYTIDFICHGVPSPMVWKRYLNYRSERADSKISNVTFRCKDSGWTNSCLKINFNDGSVYCGKVSEDFYLRSFIMDMDLRPSCYNCQFKAIHRISDITLADFWGVKDLHNDWDDDKGVSLVFVHSDKGLKLFQDCGNNIKSAVVDFKDAIAHNPSMTTSADMTPLRTAFLKDVNRIPFDKLHAKYCSTRFDAKIRRKIAFLSAHLVKG